MESSGQIYTKYLEIRRDVILANMTAQESLTEFARKLKKIIKPMKTIKLDQDDAVNMAAELDVNFYSWYDNGQEFLDGFASPFEAIITFYRLFTLSSLLYMTSIMYSDCYEAEPIISELTSKLKDCLNLAVINHNLNNKHDVFTSAIKEAFESSCAICIEELDSNSKMQLIETCKHAFCEDCLAKHEHSCDMQNRKL